MATIPASALRLRARDGAPGEAALLAGIWRRGWVSSNRSAEHVEPIAHWLTRVQAEFVPPADVLLAARGRQVIGFMVLQMQRAYVAQLFVEPHLHGQGLGRLLLGEARMRMPRGWRLHVATANVSAQRFYERYGLVRGIVDCQPHTGRERVAYHWHPS